MVVVVFSECPPRHSVHLISDKMLEPVLNKININTLMKLVPSAAVRLRMANSWPWILAVISISSQHLFRFWSQEITLEGLKKEIRKRETNLFFHYLNHLFIMVTWSLPSCHSLVQRFT